MTKLGMKQSISYPDLWVDKDGNIYHFKDSVFRLRHKIYDQGSSSIGPTVKTGTKYTLAARIIYEAWSEKKLDRHDRLTFLDDDPNNVHPSNITLTPKRKLKLRPDRIKPTSHEFERLEDETSWLGPDAIYL